MANEMDFSGALMCLKAGLKVARLGWNGKGMFIYMVRGTTVDEDNLRNEAYTHLKGHGDSTGVVTIASHIDMKTADGSVAVGWKPSNLDLFATDWEVVI